MKRRSFLATFTLVAGVSVCAQTPTRPTFRSDATLVPVDVRVIDAKGNPVTNLTKADFSIRENGAPQDISQFLQHTLAAMPDATSASAVARAGPDAPLAPQNQRIFLIVLGRGHLQAPANGVDGAIAFVRERLLPQDTVAVMAWNRATDFTANRAEIIGVLEGFKTRHDGIENRLANWFSGLRAVYGKAGIPAAFQSDIDAVFATTDTPKPRGLPAAPVADAKRIADTTLKNSEDLLRQQAQQVEGFPKVEGLPVAPFAPSAQTASLDMKFDEFVASNKQTIQDVANIYTGIEYLRYVTGEKHLVFVTEDGFMLPSGDDDEGLAAMANDARVAIDTIHTGGVRPTAANGPANFNQLFKVGGLRDISRMTGGTASAFRDASDAIDRIDRATRASYLLGYYPSSPTLDGRYRKITVTVNRPDLTLQYRHGYYARPPLAPLDRRQALSYSRISAAGLAATTIRDLHVDVRATSYTEPDGKNLGVSGHITVSPDRVHFSLVDGRHVALLHVAVFCGNARAGMVGQRWREVPLDFSEAMYQRFLKDGLGIDITIPVTAAAAYIKAIVYDPGADLIGTATGWIR